MASPSGSPSIGFIVLPVLLIWLSPALVLGWWLVPLIGLLSVLGPSLVVLLGEGSFGGHVENVENVGVLLGWWWWILWLLWLLAEELSTNNESKRVVARIGWGFVQRWIRIGVVVSGRIAVRINAVAGILFDEVWLLVWHVGVHLVWLIVGLGWLIIGLVWLIIGLG